MARSARFKNKCNLDTTNYDAWKTSVLNNLALEGVLDCIDPKSRRIKMNEEGIPYKSNGKGKLWYDQKAKSIICSYLSANSEERNIQKSALHLWCILHLRYGEGKAPEARRLMAEYHEILCRESGIKTILDDASEWAEIRKVMEMFPLSWFADDSGLTRLISVIQPAIEIYYADHKGDKIPILPDLSEPRFAGLRNCWIKPNNKRSKR